MLIFLSVTIIALYLSSIHINFKIKTSFDLETGQAIFALNVLTIPLLNARGLLENRTLTESDLTLFIRNKKRNYHIKVDKNSVSESIKAIKEFNFTLLTNLDVVKIDLKLEYGNGDPFKTFAYLGLIKLTFYSLVSALKCHQPIDATEQFIPKFNMRSIKGELVGIFKLSTADIIYGLLLSKVRKFQARRKKIDFRKQHTSD